MSICSWSDTQNQSLDLLKACSHQQTQRFLDIILDNGLLPSITRLTRITQHLATLIDNIFISKILQCNFDSAVIINNISDHLLIITMMKQTKVTDKSAIEFYSHKLNSNKIHQINEEIHAVDWNGVLNSEDCNENSNVFCDILHESMNKVAPLQHVRISGKRCYTEPWMTTGIETSNYTKKLYPRIALLRIPKNTSLTETSWTGFKHLQNEHTTHPNVVNTRTILKNYGRWLIKRYLGKSTEEA